MDDYFVCKGIQPRYVEIRHRQSNWKRIHEISIEFPQDKGGVSDTICNPEDDSLQYGKKCTVIWNGFYHGTLGSFA
ncbi:hypothetical protein TNCV_3569031 [Trichonephila clavipes]|nr:hypothetical protein TNCV_3569031 [Trichonephila clavipes]